MSTGENIKGQNVVSKQSQIHRYQDCFAVICQRTNAKNIKCAQESNKSIEYIRNSKYRILIIKQNYYIIIW
jgi:hypothetical protein